MAGWRVQLAEGTRAVQWKRRTTSVWSQAQYRLAPEASVLSGSPHTLTVPKRVGCGLIMGSVSAPSCDSPYAGATPWLCPQRSGPCSADRASMRSTQASMQHRRSCGILSWRSHDQIAGGIYAESGFTCSHTCMLCIRIHIYIYMYIYIYTETDNNLLLSVSFLASRLVLILCTRLRACIHACTYTHIHPDTCACVCVLPLCTDTNICVFIHTYIDRQIDRWIDR